MEKSKVIIFIALVIVLGLGMVYTKSVLSNDIISMCEKIPVGVAKKTQFEEIMTGRGLKLTSIVKAKGDQNLTFAQYKTGYFVKKLTVIALYHDDRVIVFRCGEEEDI